MADISSLVKEEVHCVTGIQGSARLQDYALGKFISCTSNNAVKKAIKKGLVFINDKRGYTADWVKDGDELVLYKEPIKHQKKTVDLDFQVLYEDDYLAVVNKPAGVLVSGNKHRTLENALPKKLKKSKKSDVVSPEPIHRLDYPTTGIVLIGKTRQALVKLNQLFENRDIQKKYLAITIGHQNKTGIIEEDIDGKLAKSAYSVLSIVESERFLFLNLVELDLFTGRRHQLRKHLSGIGNPILGDAEYGKEGLILKGKGLYLHACQISFVHPFTNESLTIYSEPPKKFKQIFPEISFVK